MDAQFHRNGKAPKLATPMTRVQPLFEEALALAQELRSDFLLRACVDAPEVRREVEELLHFYEVATRESFLEATVEAPSPSAAGQELTGTRLGPYQIRELIGRGGMGAVYRAERVEDYRQEVAIKLLPAGAASDEMLKRLLGERQVLAGLDHANIARLLDGGVTEDGRPYLVMDYIAGERLDRYCEVREVDFSGRVRLLIEACKAVEHAHRRGVIHRDLKPGNMLVTPDGSLRIVDFGLARGPASDRSADLTHTGAILGTPGYLAPEQASSAKEVGPAADVYGLGATLYALLAGRPPFHAGSTWEVLHQVRESEPLPPSHLTTGLPRDLETVCLKCLQKDPKRRYSSAQELATDLGRFLQGIPVRARRPSRLEQVVRWCHRRPLPAVLATTLVLVVVSSFVTVTILWLRAAESQAKAERRQAVALDALDLFTANAKQRLKGSALSQEERTALVKALERYDALLAESTDDPSLRARTAAACQDVARIFYEMQEYPSAARVYARAVALLTHLKEEFPDHLDYRLELARANCRLGTALGECGSEADFLGPLRASVAEAEELVDHDPSCDDFRGALACHQATLAKRLEVLGSLAEAESLCRQALSQEEQLLRRHSQDPNRHIRADSAAGLLAEIALRRGDRGLLLAHVRKRLELSRRFRREFPNDPALLEELTGDARACDLLVQLGQPDEAKQVLEEGITFYRNLSQRFPAIPIFRREYAALQTLQGYAQMAGHPQEAGAAFREAARVMKSLIQDFPDQYGYGVSLAQLLAHCPHSDVRNVEAAEQLASQVATKFPDELASFSTLGEVLYRKGDLQSARALLERAIALKPPDSPRNCWTAQLCLAVIEWDQGDREQARAVLAVTAREMHAAEALAPLLKSLLEEAEEKVGPTNERQSKE